jgi:hypothetical protein
MTIAAVIIEYLNILFFIANSLHPSFPGPRSVVYQVAMVVAQPLQGNCYFRHRMRLLKLLQRQSE